MPRLRHAQLRYLSIITLSWLAVFQLTRGVLLLTHLGQAKVKLLDLPHIFGVGLVHDLSFVLYATLPLALYLLACPDRVWRQRWHRQGLRWLAGLAVYLMLFTAVAEWLFWDEFGVRFNFIAVDYLVYSKEVIANILESYPVYPLLAVIAIVAIAVHTLLHEPLVSALAAPRLPRSRAVMVALALLVGTAAVSLGIGQDWPRGFDGNTYQRELARNGPYQFFAAFRNNELDYAQFYATLSDDTVAALLRAEVREPNARFISADPIDIRRRIDSPGEPRRLNVVLIMIESLSASFLGSLGDSRGLTPNLDALRAHSLVFTQFYATGTRTDRGLEAVTLSIPPTPGRSIVKRLGRESGHASLGRQFQAQGYDSVFLYGGRGYFDNMNAFFSGNGYRIVDQSSVAESEISFKNAWGMADEDLYRQTLKVADADHAAGRPFFLQLMTTSNHRPYTYPEGRIDVPSGSGRAGAVKYTDHAIGQFLEEARRKPWFDGTIFVIVADHTASSAGKEDLPVGNYHIPLLIHAPAAIAPREVTTVASQIDLAPTLLGLLNFDYTSTFFGRDLLRADPTQGRALIGNYQNLGLLEGNSLAILGPRHSLRRLDDALGISVETTVDVEDTLMRRNIAYYQGASHAFKNRLLDWRPDTVASEQITELRP
ncbi:MAG: LTA synthase family protein [Thiotrichales bacterium]